MRHAQAGRRLLGDALLTPNLQPFSRLTQQGWQLGRGTLVDQDMRFSASREH